MIEAVDALSVSKEGVCLDGSWKICLGAGCWD